MVAAVLGAEVPGVMLDGVAGGLNAPDLQQSNIASTVPKEASATAQVPEFDYEFEDRAILGLNTQSSAEDKTNAGRAITEEQVRQRKKRGDSLGRSGDLPISALRVQCSYAPTAH